MKFKNFTSDVPVEQAENFVPQLMESMLQALKQKCQATDQDRLRLSFHHDSLKTPVWIEFSTPAELTSQKLIDKIQQVQQSNEEFHFSDGRVVVHMTHVTPPRGSGHTNKNKRVMVDQFVTQKRSIVQINNDEDQMCLARAIVVARTYANKVDTPEWKKLWKSIRQSDRAKQRNEAEVLLKQAALPRDQGCGLPKMQELQQVLAPEYTLKVHPQEIRGTLLFR